MSLDVSKEVLEKASGLGISKEHLSDMVNASTRITHPKGNRRYYDFVFMLEGKTVSYFGRIDGKEEENTKRENKITTPIAVNCIACHGTRKIPVFDECDSCDGAGCIHCDKGLVPAFIDCPDCVKQAKRV